MDGSQANPTFQIADWLSRGGNPPPFVSLPAAGSPPADLVPADLVIDDVARRAARAPRFLLRDLSEDAPQPPVELRFTAAELQSADQQGYDRGHAAGLAEAAASQAAFETMTLAAIAGAMTGARASVTAVAEAAATALARALIAAMHAVMPALIANTAVDEVDAMLACVLPGLAREPDIQVQVAPEITDAIGVRLNRLSREDRERITVAGSHGMAAGEARIAWSAGHAERQPGQVWRQVMAAFRLPSDETAIGETVTKETLDGE